MDPDGEDIYDLAERAGALFEKLRTKSLDDDCPKLMAIKAFERDYVQGLKRVIAAVK